MSRPARVPFVPGVRAMRVLWRMAVPIVVAIQLVVWPLILQAPEHVLAQARTIAWTILAFFLFMGLVREILSPLRPGLRLVPLSDLRAQRIDAILRTLAILFLGAELAIYLIRVNRWNDAAADLVSLVRTVGLVAFGAVAVARFGLLRWLEPKSPTARFAAVRRILLRVGWPLGVLTAVFYVGARGLGWVALARWVVEAVAWSLLAAVGVVWLFGLARDRLRRAIQVMQAERSAATTPGVGGDEAPPSPTYVGLERVLGGALQIGAALGMAMLVLRIWEVDRSQLEALGRISLFGSGDPTLGQLAAGLFRIGLVLVGAALLRNLFIFFLFPRANLDVGIRYAVLTIFRYVVWLAVASLSLGVLGIDASALAVFAGAFGVGLAFGLQEIFANFFSGLIMLIERPIRIGDLVEIGGTEGRVVAIRLRGTQLRQIDGTIMTIPNREILGSRLTNLSHGMAALRVVVPIGVAYDSDLRLVDRTLVEVAQRDGRILADPKPFARLENFGDSSLDFKLYAFVAVGGELLAVASDLRRAVHAAFHREGIQIPFPRRDVHVHEADGSAHVGLPGLPATATPADSAAAPPRP